MEKKIINTDHAPAPIGPYEQAILAGDTLYISGQVALDTAGNMDNKDIESEAHRVMQNLKAILSAAGMGFGDVVKTTILLADMSLFAQVNEIYGKYFPRSFPARETFAVKGLPKQALVEISMIAVR